MIGRKLSPGALATWNVNSLRVRLPRVLEFLELHQPDVVCLQETKVAARRVPRRRAGAAGYTATHHSAAAGRAWRSSPGPASS